MICSCVVVFVSSYCLCSVCVFFFVYCLCHVVVFPCCTPVGVFLFVCPYLCFIFCACRVCVVCVASSCVVSSCVCLIVCASLVYMYVSL